MTTGVRSFPKPPPPKPGYYWVDLDDGEGWRVVQVTRIGSHIELFFTGTDLGNDWSDHADNPHVRWVGPLEPPV